MQSSESKKTAKAFIKLLLKGLVLFLLCLVLRRVLFDILWLDPDFPDAYDRSYERALLRQVDALTADRDPQTIVFGSSYVPFGVDTSEMESVLGQKTQILGVEGSMGIPILIDLARKAVRPGDTLIYMLGAANQSYEDPVAICAALEPDKELLMSYIESRDGLKDSRNPLIWRKIYTLTIGRPVIWFESKLSGKKQIYSIDSFDECGNMTADRLGSLPAMDEYNEAYEYLEMDDMDKKTAEKLNEFKAWCDKNGVTLVIAYAPFLDVTIENDDDALNAFHNELSKALHMDFINRPQDTLMEKKYFYNHPAHLNSEGARIYSHALAGSLIRYREEKK